MVDLTRTEGRHPAFLHQPTAEVGAAQGDLLILFIIPLVCSIDRVGVYSAIASVDPVNMRLKRHSTVTRAIAVMRITFFIAFSFHFLLLPSLKYNSQFFKFFLAELTRKSVWQASGGDLLAQTGNTGLPCAIWTVDISP